jgi:UDP-N-acetyl-D-galactosamine dehydrogenase
VSSSETVGRHLKRGAVVIFESTVYPGATEEICVPVIEKHSGFKWKRDFNVGYSPERINPGDKNRTLTKIVKVVSGDTPETLAKVEKLYGDIIEAGVYPASSIRVAEAAKVIENTQRDLNIALMNELSIIFSRMGIDTLEVLEAAGTKWNFLPFRPGLVGGHCIGVDPYYLTHKAEMLGYQPQIILAGRRINDGMGKYVAEQTVKRMIASGHAVKDASVLVLGMTFKEDCPDLRNSKVIDVIHELQSFGVKVHVHDPIADSDECRHEYGIGLTEWEELPESAAIIAAGGPQAVQGNGTRHLARQARPGRRVRRRQVRLRPGSRPRGRPYALAALDISPRRLAFEPAEHRGERQQEEQQKRRPRRVHHAGQRADQQGTEERCRQERRQVAVGHRTAGRPAQRPDRHDEETDQRQRPALDQDLEVEIVDVPGDEVALR